VHHPEDLFDQLNEKLENFEKVTLQALSGEELVLFESFLPGKEFSCIVIQDNHGNPIALPPTQIIKGGDVFDYRSKYLPGMSRKITPIDVPDEHLRKFAPNASGCSTRCTSTCTPASTAS
jgi:D-alanine-D-alanine ligase